MSAGTNQIRRRYKAEICGDDMKTRCDYCCGAFGLIRRRYFDHQFCCEACEGAYKEERARIAAQFKSGFYQTLTNTNGT
jgi:predicted nucleic acid-binding Zn ribbon protein